MTRFGTALLIASGACGAIAVAACGDNSVGGPPVSAGGGGSGNNTSSGGSGNTPSNGGSGNMSNGGSVSADMCTGACCPTDASCYSSSAAMSAPGAACMARISNTPKKMQFRQTWIDILTPKGNTIPIVLSTLNTYTQLTEMACNTPMGATGYMQAVDLDLDAGTSTVGYVKYVLDTKTAISDGLCFVDIGQGADSSGMGWKDIADYGMEKNFDFSLPASQMSSTKGWPTGLPAPMPQPWKVGPAKAKRLMKDFKLPDDRQTLITSLAAGGENAGFDGVFYFDESTGTSHGYSPVSYQVIYDAASTAGAAPTSYIVVPIREAELTYRTNDPMHPNCIGKYNADKLDPNSGCVDNGTMMTTAPGWVGNFDTKAGEGDAHVEGYFLITELEQVYSKVLGSTLCVSYPTPQQATTDGWATDTEKRCRKSAKWDPSKDDQSGLPPGDWCAATNSAATASCHDSYHSVSYHAFQAFKVKSDHCAAL